MKLLIGLIAVFPLLAEPVQESVTTKAIVREYAETVSRAKNKAITQLHALALLKLRVKDKPAAVEAYEAVLKINPKDFLAKRQLASLKKASARASTKRLFTFAFEKDIIKDWDASHWQIKNGVVTVEYKGKEYQGKMVSKFQLKGDFKIAVAGEFYISRIKVCGETITPIGSQMLIERKGNAIIVTSRNKRDRYMVKDAAASIPTSISFETYHKGHHGRFTLAKLLFSSGEIIWPEEGPDGGKEPGK